MTTWRSIDPPGYGASNASTFAKTFWLSPATGEIIAVYGDASFSSFGQVTLWDTRDGGAHWARLTTPGLMSLSADRNPYVAWSPRPSAPLTICSSDVGVTSDDSSGDFPLFCSLDGGKTWQSRPNISPVDSGENTSQTKGSVFAITKDGSLLATLSDGANTTLYQLPPGASQWRSLGDEPAHRPAYSRSTPLSGGVVWSGPTSDSSLFFATS
jgi:hypothetical protein